MINCIHYIEIDAVYFKSLEDVFVTTAKALKEKDDDENNEEED